MITSMILDGAVKLVQVIRYGKKSNRPDVVRLYEPRSPIPEKILVCSKYARNLFRDEETGKQFKLERGTLTPL